MSQKGQPTTENQRNHIGAGLAWSSKGLEHHCGVCSKILTRPNGHLCIVSHCRPCEAFHQALFIKDHQSRCKYCAREKEIHGLRYRRIQEMIDAMNANKTALNSSPSKKRARLSHRNLNGRNQKGTQPPPLTMDSLDNVLYLRPRYNRIPVEVIHDLAKSAMDRLKAWLPRDNESVGELNPHKHRLLQEITRDIELEADNEAAIRQRRDAFWEWLPTNHQFRKTAREEGFRLPDPDEEEYCRVSIQAFVKQILELNVCSTGDKTTVDEQPPMLLRGLPDNRQFTRKLGRADDLDLLGGSTAYDLDRNPLTVITDRLMDAEKDPIPHGLDPSSDATRKSSSDDPSKEDTTASHEIKPEHSDPAVSEQKQKKARVAKAKKPRHAANKKARAAREADIEEGDIYSWDDETVLSYFKAVKPDAFEDVSRYLAAWSSLGRERRRKLFEKSEDKQLVYFNTAMLGLYHTEHPRYYPRCLKCHLRGLQNQQTLLIYLHSWTSGKEEYNQHAFNSPEVGVLCHMDYIGVGQIVESIHGLRTINSVPEDQGVTPLLVDCMVAVLVTFARTCDPALAGGLTKANLSRIKSLRWWPWVEKYIDGRVTKDGVWDGGRWRPHHDLS